MKLMLFFFVLTSLAFLVPESFACPEHHPIEFSQVHACGRIEIKIPKNNYQATYDSRTKTFKNITVTDPNIDRGNTPVHLSLGLVNDNYFSTEIAQNEISFVRFRNYMDQLCNANSDCGTSALATPETNANQELLYRADLYFTKFSRFKSAIGDWNLEIEIKRVGYSGTDLYHEGGYFNF